MVLISIDCIYKMYFTIGTHLPTYMYTLVYVYHVPNVSKVLF